LSLGFTLDHVTKRKVPPGMDQPLTILRDVSLEIPGGAVTVLLGPAGAGKTTLLRLLARLDEPTEGRVLAGGRALDGIPPAEHRRRVGYVRTRPVILPGKVEENLNYGLRIRGVPESDWVQRIHRRILQVKLTTPHLGREDGSLTIAEKFRVATARALVLDPEALLLDDPAAGLDTLSAAELVELLKELHRETGMTFVVATRSVKAAETIADRIVLLQEGRLVEEGDAKSFLESPATPAAKAYLATTTTEVEG